jgi:hypothetical protein
MSLQPMEVKASKTIPEGMHTAIVSKVEERLEPYHYIDIYFLLNDVNVEIKQGFPAILTDKSKLGAFLKYFGVNVVVGQTIDIESCLKGKKVSLMTINKVTPRGTFAKIVEESVKVI